ncbi:hypothetical protein EZJ49_04820 [Bdellovibrio bacteriovorus]|uniref:hypothetical protein n=1 Tax=Bdellovibrio bacteriovorus TaxID=959 RepID=UPI0021CE7F53|nr:hypothetical protein [Bdellovibrio bacteriovorus]UXR65572.1 hypothetical protein EZJ49_04820 [Bdellovibrio bacteriovorus]
MRKRKIVFTAAFMSLALGASVYSFSGKSEERAPAAAEKSSWRPPPVGKHLATFHVELKSEADIPEDSSDEVTLVARVLVNQDLQSDFSYSWSLPEGVSVVDGEIADSLANVKSGQVVELKLTVVGFSKEKQKMISLGVKAHAGNEVLGNSAVIVSRAEDTLEAGAPELRRSAEAQLGNETFKRRRK